MRQCTVKPAWIGHTLKRRPCWIGQTRLIPSVFYTVSFQAFLKWKTAKRILLQTDNIFSLQIKKHTAFLTRTQIKVLGISEEQKIQLDIFGNFLKKKHFLHFKTTKMFFWFQFAVLKECNTFDLNSVPFVPSLQPTGNRFCANESDIDLQAILHPLWTIGFSTVAYIKFW